MQEEVGSKMDSISYITQKHCRTPLNIISAVLLAVMAVTALGSTAGYAGTVCGLFFAVMAVFTFLYTRGSARNCTLLQIPLVVMSFAAFFLGIVMGALGFAIVHYSGMYEYVSGFLLQYGYRLIIPAQQTGAALGVGSLLVFMMSFFAFCAAKYLSTVKSCLNNVISRHGARIFSVVSVLMFVTAASAAAAFVLSCGGFGGVMADSFLLSVFAEIVILALLLLFSGISASSFISATYAFKVFEEKMMKVETNADGTVYVPIKEDSDREAAPAPIPVPKPAASDGRMDKQKKGFIKSTTLLDVDDAIDGSHSEYDII